MTTLSVCIPWYRTPVELIADSIASAVAAMPSAARLFLFPSGPEAVRDVHLLDLPEDATVVATDQPLSLVENWNRALSRTEGELVHILHSDDTVAPSFYRTVLALVAQYPRAGIYATASGTVGDPDPGPGANMLLEGRAAAEFLLVDERHSCGNVVLPRRVIDDHGPFRSEYPYCPDEEAYLRYAAFGGVAFNDAPLYLERAHDEQAGFRSWLEPDFVDIYVRSRVAGAAAFGADVVQLAEDSTRRRVVSVAVTLALAGHRTHALQRLDDLERADPVGRSYRRVRVARAALKVPLLLPLARLRRRMIRPVPLRRGSGTSHSASP